VEKISLTYNNSTLLISIKYKLQNSVINKYWNMLSLKIISDNYLKYYIFKTSFEINISVKVF